MKSSHLKPQRRWLSGLTALAVLLSTLAPTAAAYAGRLEPSEETNDKRASKPLPAGVDAEGIERKSSKVAALWVKRGDTLCAQKNYTEALEFYEKAADKGFEGASSGFLRVADAYLAQQRYTEALSCYEKANSRGLPGTSEKLSQALEQIVLKGNHLYEEGHVTEAFKAARYGNEDGKELVAELGVEAGEAYAAQGNHAEAVKSYEQAADYGSEDAKDKLEALKRQAAEEARKLAEEQRKAAEDQRQREATERLRLERVRPSWLKSKDEAVFQRFLKGVLVYRPTEGSDVGRIELRISDLANPLEGIFDLSRCGDAGRYLSIATGYRKGKIEANEDKVEIWLAPRFLIEQNLSGDAKHFQPIMGSWDGNKAPVGLFFTWGGWNGTDSMKYYDYQTSQSMDELSNDENIYGKWERITYFGYSSFLLLYLLNFFP